MPISGPVLQEKAGEVAVCLGHENFSCSSEWLYRFKKRHKIVDKRTCEESATVDQESVDSWRAVTLPRLLEGYHAKDVFNMDDTVLFFRLLLDKLLSFKEQQCLGGKMSKDRTTVLVGCSADGCGIRCCTLVKTKFRLQISCSENFFT